MTITVCFDALGTCFGVEVLVDAVDKLLGKELSAVGSGSKMVVMDWVCRLSISNISPLLIR
jgi:2-haloacid dehalogenase